MKPTTLCGEFHKSKKKWVPASVCRCRCQHVIVSHSLSKDRAKLQITFDYRIYIIFFLYLHKNPSWNLANIQYVTSLPSFVDFVLDSMR